MNCKRTRVEPVFGWLRDHGGPDWPAELLALCEGLHLPGMVNGRTNGRKPHRVRKHTAFRPGSVLAVELEEERKVKPSPERLAWMIRNAHRLVPRNRSKARELSRRVLDNPEREAALETLDSGTRKGVGKKLILERPTRSDCLVECKSLFLWIEGQRHEWLATSSKWDISRDRLARSLEAVWNLAQAAGKECCLILCHEYDLRHHEEALIEGYRTGTWAAGWPHLQPATRRNLGERIGTVTWGRILAHWPELSEVPQLANLAVEVVR